MNKAFEDVQVGEEFEHNGNVYCKVNDQQAALVLDEEWLVNEENKKPKDLN